jgi:PhnB protein
MELLPCGVAIARSKKSFPLSISPLIGRLLRDNVNQPAFANPGRDRPDARLTTRKGDSMPIQPYLFFDGRCEEAINFYRNNLGAEVTMLMRFKDSPEPPQPGSCGPNDGDKVMHASLRVGDTTILASDGRCEGRPTFQGFALSFTVPNEAQADRLFNALSAGGQIQMPLAKTFFSPRFGMVADRFGVSWMIYVTPASNSK